MKVARYATGRFDSVADLVSAEAGLVLSAACRTDIESAARRIMAEAGIAGEPELLDRLQADSGLLDDLIAECTVGETYFFREPSHFAFIRDEVIPSLRRLRGPGHALRLWSAGCASGEEAYSLAILLEEMGLQSQAHVLATDISRSALARAESAVYGAWSLRGEGARLVGAYLRRVGGRFELAARFRRRVEFAHLNLAQDVYPTFATKTVGLDLVLCRNVLIYLEPKTVRAVAQRLHESLAPGGFLIAGPSDPLLGEHAPFDVVMTPAGLLYRKRVAAGRDARLRPMPLPPPLPSSPHPAAPVERESAAAAPFPLVPPPPGQPQPAPEERFDALDEARTALARGDGARAAELARPLLADADAAAVYLRALVGMGDAEAAGDAADAAAARHPTSVEIGFLRAALLVSQGRYAEADRALRRVLYLDPGLAVGHFVHGATLHRLGRRADAARAYRNARDLAARRPAGEILRLADGERASQLAKAAAAQLSVLELVQDAAP